MAKAGKKAAKSSPRASAGALRAKATQEDIWAHAIYLEARKKIVGPIMAFVGVLAALGLYTAFEFYRSLQNFATEQVKTTIEEGIKTKVEAMIKEAQPDLEKRLKEATDAAIAKAVKEALEKIARTSESADAAAQRLKDIALAGQPAVERTGAIAPGCDPADLTADQVRLIAIRQQTRDTGRKNPNGRPIYSNSLTVDIKGAPGPDPAALKSCVLDAVDRVVYGLNPKWFNPDQVTRIDKRDQFRFAVDVWGITTISASVYLKGQPSPLVMKGAFIAQDKVDQLLVQGS